MAFGKRNKDERPLPPGGAPAPTELERTDAYAAFRAANPTVPAIPPPRVEIRWSIAQAVLGGPVDGLLDGWMFEQWAFPEPARPLGACVFRPDGTIRVVMLLTVAPTTVLLVVDDGSSSEHAVEPYADGADFAKRMLTMTLNVLGPEAEIRARRRKVGLPVKARESVAFCDFAGAGAAPLVEAWVVADRVEPRGPGGTCVEIWHQIEDRVTGSPITYRTPLVAAQYGPDDSITSMVAIEELVGGDSPPMLIAFQGGLRTNFGARPDLTDLAAFREAALHMLHR
jgi:hypothetical protein